jgi:hypothetical protein
MAAFQSISVLSQLDKLGHAMTDLQDVRWPVAL